VVHQLKSRSSSASGRWPNADASGRRSVAVAILSADPVVRGRFEQLSHDDLTVTMLGGVGHSSDLLAAAGASAIDVAVMDNPTHEALEQWKEIPDRPPLLVLLSAGDWKNARLALDAGATGVLDRFAPLEQIVGAITAAVRGLFVFQPNYLAGLMDPAALVAGQFERSGSEEVRLTPRELEVLAAMADGASNKAIARRLEMSFSTAKFHVASILTKLDADSRTEAVMKAAQLGLVML
jgi:DNA-binding NarL/FixJ family response regulator